MNFPSILSIIGFVLVTLGGQSLVNGNFIRDLASVAYNELIGDINVITSYVPNIASNDFCLLIIKSLKPFQP